MGAALLLQGSGALCMLSIVEPDPRWCGWEYLLGLVLGLLGGMSLGAASVPE